VIFRRGIASVLVAFLVTCGRADVPSARPFSFDKVYLVFAEEHSLEFVSGFGHVFLCLAPAAATSADDLLLCPSLNFGVDLSPAGPGLFDGAYTMQPSFALVRQNSFFQQRRLFFFELRSDAEMRARLWRELQGRLGRNYPYDFFRRNCGYYLSELLLVAQPSASLRPAGPYLTPREATNRLLDAFGVAGGLVVSSPGLLAEGRLEASAERRDALLSRSRSLAEVASCEDPALKLLYLRMWEARASSSEFAQVAAAKDELLATPQGRAAAAEIQLREVVPFTDLREAWPKDEEGLDYGVGFFGGKASAPAGVSLRFELGIRDWLTPPVQTGVLRDVRVLGLDLDFIGGRCRGELTIGELSTIRDFSGLLGAGSSGARLFFNERASLNDAHGLGFDVWSGLASRSPALGWFGLKGHLLADRLYGRARLAFVPELFLLQGMTDHGWDASVLLARDRHIGWNIGFRHRLEWGPLGGNVGLRYQSMAQVGGRWLCDWRKRF
jgi:hypothetical protein